MSKKGKKVVPIAIGMEVIHAKAAGIDIGSKSHHVSVGQNIEKDVRVPIAIGIGVYASDLISLREWLEERGVETVAMESTGDYWQNLYLELVSNGLEVVLVNGKFTKNVKGKKTDVLDCMWIQKLHTLGLLSGSFLPDDMTTKLRTYCRQRTNMVEQAARASNNPDSYREQKFLKLLNFRLDVVVKDICGLTGLKIIKDIVGVVWWKFRPIQFG